LDTVLILYLRYQEQVLARRQVLFIHGIAFFFCAKACWRQDIALESCSDYDDLELKMSGTLSSLPEPIVFEGTGKIKGHKSPYTALARHLDKYLTRELSYSSDALAAFAGVENIFSQVMSTTFYFGLATAFFDVMLLWTFKDASVRRNPAFPSWTHAGWLGERKTANPILSFLISEFHVHHTWIEWHIYCNESSRFVPLHSIQKKSLYLETLFYNYERSLLLLSPTYIRFKAIRPGLYLPNTL